MLVESRGCIMRVRFYSVTHFKVIEFGSHCYNLCISDKTELWPSRRNNTVVMIQITKNNAATFVRLGSVLVRFHSHLWHSVPRKNISN